MVGLLQVSDAPADVELVRTRLKDESSTVRWSAVVALSHSGCVEALPWLQEVAQKDEADSVREAASEGVTQLQSVIPWGRSLAEGLKAAKASGKPVLLYFRLRNSEFCQQLEEGVLTDRAVVDAAQEFVPVRLDAGREAEEARRLDVRGAPTILVLDGQRNEMDRVSRCFQGDDLPDRHGEIAVGADAFLWIRRRLLDAQSQRAGEIGRAHV